MQHTYVPNPPQAVVGHPIEILEVTRVNRSPIMLLKIRVTTSAGPVEANVRYDLWKGRAFDAIPQSDEAYRLLFASHGDPSRYRENPLADAVDAIVRPHLVRP